MRDEIQVWSSIIITLYSIVETYFSNICLPNKSLLSIFFVLSMKQSR